MENIIFLYVFFTGCVYTSFIWDLAETFLSKIFAIILGFLLGWFAAPIFIGIALRKIYKE